MPERHHLHRHARAARDPRHRRPPLADHIVELVQTHTRARAQFLGLHHLGLHHSADAADAAANPGSVTTTLGAQIASLLAWAQSTTDAGRLEIRMQFKLRLVASLVELGSPQDATAGDDLRRPSTPVP